MRRFTSAPKPERARRLVHRRHVVRVNAQSVAHAVVAREVARRFGGRDQVVRTEPEATLGNRQLDDRRAGFAKASPRALRRPTTSSSAPSISSRTRPIRFPATPVVDARHQRRRGFGQRRRVPRVVSGDHFEQQRGVGDVVRERTDLVERAGEGDEPVARDQSVRRLHPDHSAERGGLTNRTAGVRAKGESASCRPRPPPPNRPTSRRARATGSSGLRVGPKYEFSVDEPMANSSMLVLPTGTAPAASSRSTTVAL